jgi:tRNA pseudouridine38-40 synthase
LSVKSADRVQKTLRLHIAYDGTGYAGWQKQPDQPTIEGSIHHALTVVMGGRSPLTFQGASRTDAGVHAAGQVASFVHDTTRTPWDFVRGLNALTPHKICINHAEEVVGDFNARFSSRGKRYEYTIWNHRFEHPHIMQAWRIAQPLDLDRMRAASSLLLGEHDFASFRASGCQAKTTVRDLSRIDISSDQEWVKIIVEGTAFMRHMVRILVGTLAEFGLGRRSPTEMKSILSACNRQHAGRTAPAKGLCLLEVFYPDHPWQTEPRIGVRRHHLANPAPDEASEA